MKERRKKTTAIAIIVIILAAIAVFVLFEIIKTEKYETTSIEKIGEYKGAFYYEMALFPKDEIKNERVIEYKYKYEGSIVDDSQYVMLKYQYSDDYESEKQRLSTINDEYSSVTYDEATFEQPAYIYMYNEGDNSEFAIADDENKQITYVYIQCPFDFEGELYVK